MKDVVLSEQKLLKLTSCLMTDYLRTLCGVYNETRELDDITLAEIRDYCREWIKQNMRDEWVGGREV